ncbi:Trafficking protein particle complex subunit 9 [Branchiostoma belcheri]|nr:Trafficking protein particle complex subunit 9 [Branchiostoma belcheri]
MAKSGNERGFVSEIRAFSERGPENEGRPSLLQVSAGLMAKSAACANLHLTPIHTRTRPLTVPRAPRPPLRGRRVMSQPADRWLVNRRSSIDGVATGSHHISTRHTRVPVTAHIELAVLPKVIYRPRDRLESGPAANFGLGPSSVPRSKGESFGAEALTDLSSCGPKGGPSVRYSPCIIIMATAGQQTNVKTVPPRFYKDRSYRHGFLGAVSDLQKSEVLQDVVLEVEGRRFPCHRLVLSAPTSRSGARTALLIPQPGTYHGMLRVLHHGL